MAVTVVSVLLALIGCGWASARLGNAPVRPAIIRNAAGGAIAMAVTYAVGELLGATGGLIRSRLKGHACRHRHGTHHPGPQHGMRPGERARQHSHRRHRQRELLRDAALVVPGVQCPDGEQEHCRGYRHPGRRVPRRDPGFPHRLLDGDFQSGPDRRRRTEHRVVAVTPQERLAVGRR